MMSTFEFDTLARLKAQYPKHIDLLRKNGFEWDRDLAAFRKNVTGGLRVICTPKQIASMSLETLKKMIGSG